MNAHKSTDAYKALKALDRLPLIDGEAGERCECWKATVLLDDGSTESFNLYGFPESTALGHALQVVSPRYGFRAKRTTVRRLGENEL